MAGDLRLNRAETFVLGRAFTYLLNADADAQIADTLIAHLNHGRAPQGSSEASVRAAHYIHIVGGSECDLALIAYTLERLNGLADYVYAHVLARWLDRRGPGRMDTFLSRSGHTALAHPPAYRGEVISVGAVLWLGPDMMRGRIERVERYAQQRGLSIRPTTEDVARMVRLVQRQNIQANHHIATILRRGIDPAPRKVTAIRTAARHTSFPSMFVRAAIMTELAASRWDRAFAMLLRVRYRNS